MTGPLQVSSRMRSNKKMEIFIESVARDPEDPNLPLYLVAKIYTEIRLDENSAKALAELMVRAFNKTLQSKALE